MYQTAGNTVMLKEILLISYNGKVNGECQQLVT